MADERVIVDELVGAAQSALESGKDVEGIVQRFHDAGVSKSRAIGLLAQGAGLSRRDALRVVHYSKAYEAQKEVDEALQADVLDHLESIGTPRPEEAIVSEPIPLQAIGFWDDGEPEPGWPDPNLLMRAGEGLAFRQLVSYLRSGVRIHEELGYSYCRIAGGPPDEEMGNAEMTDGVWLWPEGLWVYVEKFNVELPNEFTAHARGNSYCAPKGLDLEELSWRKVDDSFWRKWASQQVSRAPVDPRISKDPDQI